jgi:pimeloyl-ACP methyl ester carboxylesterase
LCGLTRLAVSSLYRHSTKTKTKNKIEGDLAGATVSGGRHVISRIKDEVGKMPHEVWPVVAAHWSRPSFYAGMRKHIESIAATVEEMRDAAPIHEIPITVLTPGKSIPLSAECLESIGDHVQQVIAPASAHWIHLDEPELVIGSIRQMMAESVAAAV